MLGKIRLEVQHHSYDCEVNNKNINDENINKGNHLFVCLHIKPLPRLKKK